MSNARLKLTKIKKMLSNTLRPNFWLFKIIRILHPLCQSRIIGNIPKNKEKNKRISMHEIIRLIIMEMKMKIEKWSHRYDINRPRSRHGHKYSKYKKCLSIMMLICIKKQLSNIWNSVHEKVKQYWDLVQKRRCL